MEFLLCAVAIRILQTAIIHSEGPGSKLKLAGGRNRKGQASIMIYTLGNSLAFFDQRLSCACYVIVATMCLPPTEGSKLG